MRLLVITQKIDEGDDVLGFFISWVGALAKRVEGVDVICLAKGKYSLPSNVRVFSLGKERGLPKFVQAILFYIYALRAMFKSDGIFVHMAPEYVRALYPINIFFRKPIVMWYAHIRVSKVAKWAIDHVNFVLTPSKESFEYDSNKVVSTGHGINTEIFKPIDVAPEFDVLSISRISKVKKIETLVEAVKILAERGVYPSVSIYGEPARVEDDAYLKKLKEVAKDLKNISWRGSVANKDAPEVYAKHRVFVRMQGGGGFGKTELEAMSMGVPSILPTEVYRKDLGELGDELYFEEDDAVSLADRIESVSSWPAEKRSEYGRLARELVVTKHNVENVTEKIVKLLQSCVA